MKLIKDQSFDGERPLYRSADVRLENIFIGKGESSIKESHNIEAENCTFDGKYVFWETTNFRVNNCTFLTGARSSLWYSRNLKMTNCTVEAPKMFRSFDGATVEDTKFLHAQETFWHTKFITLRNVELNEADYVFMDSQNIRLENCVLNGNYSFQYCKNVEIHNCTLNSKDAFWETENVTIYNSTINGEYLAWYSDRLTLINCHVKETQPLCYCRNLKMENCTFDADADLVFEYSEVEATIRGAMTSIKNPSTGHISVDSVGEIIIDENIKAPANCVITVEGKKVYG